MKMKMLKRLLLIHWYSYEEELIDFEQINYITGKTASGKSTIIDALQLILLGETSGKYYNKAANDKSVRTLKSYLYGELGDDGDTGFHYIRTGQTFTTYVAAEFYDLHNKVTFTSVFVADCFGDMHVDTKWYILNSAIPENHFIDPKTRTPYMLDQLKTFLLHEYKRGSYESFDTISSYKAAILGRYGQLNQKYASVLQKAVPFTPISDVEQFITESICDIPNDIDVEQMQTDIRQYRKLEMDAANTKKRIEKLEAIHEKAQKHEEQSQKANEQDYIVQRADLEEVLDTQNACFREIDDKKQSLKQREEEINSLSLAKNETDQKKEELSHEYYTSDIEQKREKLDRELLQYSKEISECTNQTKKALKQITEIGAKWNNELPKLHSAEFEVNPETEAFIQNMQTLSLSDIQNFDLSHTVLLEQLQEAVRNSQAELNSRMTQIEEEVAERKQKIDNLEKGIKPYPSNVLNLKHVLEEQLFQKTQKTVKVSILADLLEIKDVHWQNAIEGYLDKQKFYLLVKEEYYGEALKIYDAERREKNIYDAGLVDIGKLRQEYDGNIQPGSLAEEIDTEDADARLYANYLLGKVIKCSSVSELNHQRTAITAECMLYKGYVARKINPRRYADPYIGRQSIQIQLANQKEELKRVEEQLNHIRQRYSIMQSASNLQVISDYERTLLQQDIEQYSRIPELNQKMQDTQKEYDSLDLMYLDKLMEQINQLTEKSKSLDEQQKVLLKTIGNLEERISHLSEESLPEIQISINQLKEKINSHFDAEWIKEIGDPHFASAKKTERTVLSLKDSFIRALEATRNTMEKIQNERIKLRQSYNLDYKMPYDTTALSNADYDNELKKLQETDLPLYEEKIKSSREKAYSKFRDDFIAKLKSNIEEVIRQINELNDSLKDSVFATDRYRFTVKPKEQYRTYYDMIMDPMLMGTNSYNLMSDTFNDKYKDEIKQLFNLLIIDESNMTAEAMEEYRKNVQTYTDYKTYLSFDLVVSNDLGDQRLSKTMRKKSGGETQIPFYISMLASFSQVCRVRQPTRNNTLRLILLDEAFSKMDGERIQESIPLLREFGLQAIFSAPPEKIAFITPLVDRNIAVYKDGLHSFTRHFDLGSVDAELLEEDTDND